jgi:hypothetical protein
MQTETGIDTQLKEAVQLTGAAWAVLAERVGGAWLVRASYHLNKSAHNELTGIMALLPPMHGYAALSAAGIHVLQKFQKTVRLAGGVSLLFRLSAHRNFCLSAQNLS